MVEAASCDAHIEIKFMNLCKHDPKQYAGFPIGMYHCPECGQMVLAGMDHPDWSVFDVDDESLDADATRLKG